jgi:DHA3 family macrolide efflux protein-like MFS transporter
MEETANKETFRSYIFFWSGQLFSLLGSMVVYFVITYWIADTYRDPVLAANAAFLAGLMMIIFMPLAGVIADRVNRKELIIVVDSLQAFVTFLLIMFFQFGLVNIWVIFIFLSLRSVCQAFHLPTVNAIIPTMVPKDKLSRINGINYLFTGVVQLFAPFLGAILLMFLSPYTILWVDVITFFIALLPLLMISIPAVNHVADSQKMVEKNSFLKEFKLGIKTLRIVPGLIIMTFLSMLLNFLIRPVDSLMALFIIENHGGGPGHLALTEMIVTGGMIAGALFTSFKKNWNNKIRVIYISIIIALIGYMIFAIAPPGEFVIIGLGGAILGFNLPIINSLYQTFVQTAVPADKLGRVTSIDHTLSSAISPLGSILSGPLALLMGIPALFFYGGLIGVICTLGFWSFTGIRHIDMDSESELKRINGKIEEITL